MQEWDLEEVRARLHAIENRMRDDCFLFVKVVNWLVFGIEPQYPSPWWERENPWLLCLPGCAATIATSLCGI